MDKIEERCMEFFRRRFPHDIDKNGQIYIHAMSYYGEWLDRFRSGHPELWMDGQSLTIYKQMQEE